MQQQLILPEGGLASFLTSNLDEIDDSRLLFGKQSGINSHRGIAEKMAGFGRNGDTEMIHAEKGEIIIHPKLLEENPRLAQEMMDAFSSSGVNLDRYTVGGEANSINPRTGQAEFFFKKLVKGVKKIVKAVAPIVVPLALNIIAPGMGAIAAGALGGGITTLIQGGNFKDALKSAAMGGVMGGISSGIKGAMNTTKTGISGRFQGFKSGIQEFGMPSSFGGSGQSLLSSQDASTVASDPTLSAQKSSYKLGSTSPTDTNLIDKVPVNMGDGILQKEVAPSMYERFMGKVPQGFKDAFYTQGTEASAGMNLADAAEAVSKQFPTLDPSGPVYQSHVESLLGQGATEAVKGSIKLVPTIGAGLALAAPMGLYDPIPEKELEDPYDGTSPSEDRLAENPERYRVGVPDIPYLRATMDDVVVPSQEQLLYEQYLNQPQYAAAGGEMKDFPRRTGYIAGRGTETSDSIPAMLSDGEFVMNARAVRGAGNGSREKGVRRMYDIMRAFEGGAVA
jgi:hypothetical protein